MRSVNTGDFSYYYKNRFVHDVESVMVNSSRTYGVRPCVDYVFMDVSDFHNLKIHDYGSHSLARFYFAAAIYFTNLVPQVFNKMEFGALSREYENGLMYDFHRCSGWPMISCGLGGVMDPIHTLWKAHLMPGKGNEETFAQVIAEGAEVIIPEAVQFISGNQPNLNPPAYKRLVGQLDGRNKEFEGRLKAAVQYFIDWILAPECNKMPKSFSTYWTTRYTGEKGRLRCIGGDMFALDAEAFDVAVVFVRSGFNPMSTQLTFGYSRKGMKLPYVIYTDRPYGRRHLFRNQLEKFQDLEEAENYIFQIVDDALDAALRRGSRIAFYGVEIRGMESLHNEELTIDAISKWLDKHPEATVTLVDKYDSFNRHFNDNHKTQDHEQ